MVKGKIIIPSLQSEEIEMHRAEVTSQGQYQSGQWHAQL